MLWANLFIWWYSGGVKRRLLKMSSGLASTADMFSIGLLLKTLFNPYKQISADERAESLPEQMKLLLDNLISRIIGFFVRTFMIIIGLIALFLQVIYNIILILLHFLAPLIPVVGLTMMLIGWLPL